MRVGVDVGGTKTDAIAVDASGVVAARVRLATGWGADGVVRTVLDAVHALVAGRAGDADILSVGIGMPGHVEPGSTHVTQAVNLGVTDLDVTAAIGGRLGVPVAVENDVKAAAVGAYAVGDGVAGRALAYLNLGTGIAAAIVRDGVLWRGDHGTAGEIGHIVVDPHGPLCGCGQHGCVEALAGGGRIAARWGRPSPLPVVDVLDAADAGDARAARIRDDLMRGVAAAVRILVLTVDAEVVVLGGGLTALGDRLMNGVVAELDASAAASAFMRSLRVADRVEVLPRGSSAAAFGAALIGAGAGKTVGGADRICQEAAVHG